MQPILQCLNQFNYFFLKSKDDVNKKGVYCTFIRFYEASSPAWNEPKCRHFYWIIAPWIFPLVERQVGNFKARRSSAVGLQVNCKNGLLEFEFASHFRCVFRYLVAKYVYVRTHIDCFLVDGKSVERYPIKNRKGERPSTPLEISLRGP